jgi:hypothetical protein
MPGTRPGMTSFEEVPAIIGCISSQTLRIGTVRINPCVLSRIASTAIHESFAERNANWMDLRPQEAPSFGITALLSGSHR